MVTGWYDHCGTGPVDFWAHTMAYGTPEQKASTHLVIGLWDHSGDPALLPGPPCGYDFGEAARRDHHAAEVAFFDRHLKGRRLGSTLIRFICYLCSTCTAIWVC